MKKMLKKLILMMLLVNGISAVSLQAGKHESGKQTADEEQPGPDRKSRRFAGDSAENQGLTDNWRDRRPTNELMDHGDDVAGPTSLGEEGE